VKTWIRQNRGARQRGAQGIYLGGPYTDIIHHRTNDVVELRRRSRYRLLDLHQGFRAVRNEN
jgi:hypothetical protein